MITELIITFFINLLEMCLNWFPIITVPAELLTSLTSVVDLLIRTRFWIPWTTIFICVAWLIALYSAKFIWSIVDWLIKRIPIIG